MEIITRRVGDFTEVYVKGRLDAYWAGDLAKRLEVTIREGAHRVRVNLAEVTYVSSIGIRVLVQFYKQLHEIHGAFVVSSPSEPVKKVLDLARLSELLMPETPPAPAAAAEAGRALEWKGARLEVFHSAPGASLQCRVVGSPELLDRGGFGPEQCRLMQFPGRTVALGLGAFGNGFDDCRGRFGEFLAVAGAAAYLPTDGTNVPDYLVSAGTFVPELQVLYGLVCEGAFASLARFESSGESGSTPLSELVEASLEIAGAPAAAVVIVAESAGLIGAALRRSPASGAPEAAPLAFPQVRQWLSFTAERAHARSLAVVAGVAARSAEGPLAPLLRPLAGPNGPLGHFHAAAFSYRPLKKGRLDLETSVKSIFEGETLQGVLHLLGDDRDASGAGQSEFVRGACWVGRLSEVIS